MPGVLMLVGWWVCYRVVNLPGFADFLIAVEAEMSKVSWPSRSELMRASLVVLLMLFLLAAALSCYDLLLDLYLYAYSSPVLVLPSLVPRQARQRKA